VPALAPTGSSSAAPKPAGAASSTNGPGTLVKKYTLPLRNKVTPKSVCTQEQPEDCVALGTQIQYGGPGFTKDPAKAATYYRIACDADDTAGCTILADLFFDGTGVKKDESEGMRLLRHACKQGDCSGLAFRLVESEVPAEHDEALAHFESICDDAAHIDISRALACNMRADRARTRVDGAPSFLKGCNLGYDSSCNALARLYFEDRFPNLKPAAATRALEEMCDRQYAPACDGAAQRHFEGKGVPASRAEADRWLQKGCDAGDEQLCELIARRRGR
jgi:TPR repeat protein